MADLSDYIKAGYIPQMGCNLQSALEYVTWSEHYPAIIRDSRIWIAVDGLEIPTPYYWEDNNLFKRVG